MRLWEYSELVAFSVFDRVKSMKNQFLKMKVAGACPPSKRVSHTIKSELGAFLGRRWILTMDTDMI